MSSIGLDLSDCCKYLESNKKTERRRRIEDLKLLLENTHTKEFLNKNSDSCRGVSWNSVFCSLHNCLLREADCYSEEKAKKILPATDKAVKGCCGLLILVVSSANSGCPRLPCQELFSCILQVYAAAESNEIVLNSIIGETYINLLALGLSSEKYWGELTFQTWKDLGKLSLAILKKLSSEKMKATVISIFNVILLQGGRLSPLIIKSKALLGLFPEILQTLVTSKYPLVELSCLHLTHTICIQFGKEFRLSVCTFIDTILPYIMTLNDNRLCDAQFKEVIAQVLIEMVSIRMADQGWIQEASSLLSFAEKELSNISKHKLVLPPIPKIVILAVKLTKKLHEMKAATSEECDDHSAKRRKVSSCIGSVLDNIKVQSAYSWPWLCFLDQLLEKAPEVVSEEDVLGLCQYFCDSISQSSDPMILRYLTKSSVRLLNIYKEKKNVYLEKNLQDLQSVLWASILRSISTPILTDLLIQLASDLVPDWIQHESAKALLELFVDQKIPLTKNSLTAVQHLSSSGFIGSSTVRISLISWSLSGELYSPEVLLSLILRSKLPVLPKCFHSEITPTDTELFYIICSFGRIPSTQENFSDDNLSEEDITSLIEDKTASDAFLKILIEKLSKVNSLSGLLQISTCLCTLQSYFIKYNMSIKSKHEDILDRAIQGLFSQLENTLQSSNGDHLQLVTMASDFFCQFSKLKESRFADKTLNLFNVLIGLLKNQHILSTGSKETQSIMKIVEAEWLQSVEGNHEEFKEKSEMIIVNTIFNLIKTFSDDDKVQAYINLINLCLCDLSLTSQSGLKIAVAVASKVVNTKHMSSVLMKDIISLELKLCHRWLLHYTGTLQIIDLVDATIEPLFRCDQKGELKSQLYLLISSLCKQNAAKKYGSTIMIKLASLLVHVIQIDSQGQNVIDTHDGRRSLLLYFVDFLNCRYHEVRVRAAEFLPTLFGIKISLQKRPEHKEAFNKTLKAVDNLFIVKEGKSPEDVKEEGLNRSCCALKILLDLTCSCYVWRRNSLYYLFKIISAKNINQSLFQKSHQYLERILSIDNIISFLEQNLDYILWNWYKEYNTFERFPYHFMNYDCLPSFLNDYKTIIVPIYLENLDLDGFESFCGAISTSKSDVAISCFPEVIGCLLPKLCASEMKFAEKLNTFIQQLIDQATIKRLLNSDLPKVLMTVFMKLNDIDNLQKLCGPSALQLPTASPLNICIDGVLVSLRYIQRTIPNPQQSLLVFLSNEYPGHVQFLLQNLLAHISIATTTEIRSLCFLQYITLCELISTDLDSNKKMSGYVIWHAIHALLNLAKTDLALQAITYLYRFLEKCFPTCAKYVDYTLDDLLPPIVAFSLENSELGHVACKIKELLVSKKDLLSRVVAYLPLEETTANLEEELRSFLRRQNPDFVALDRLSNQLTLRKEELSFLYEQVKDSNCFSDDCSKSLVHNLISKLVSLATSANSDIKVSAARCLGQIGPKNVYTLALQPESNSVPPPLAEKVLLLLLPLLVHNDSELSEAASAAVTELLCTAEGLTSLEQLKGVEKALLIPFCPSGSEKKKSIPQEFSSEKLSWASCFRVMGSISPGGWAVWSGGDHTAWITSVVPQLLSAFNDGLLPLLAPVASKQLEVSEELMPYIVNIIMDLSETFPEGLKIVQSNITHFFKKHFELRSSREKCEDSSIYLNRKSVQSMINIVNFRRLKALKLLEDERKENLGKLSVSFLHVAYAAQFCRAYFTSLLYTELWVESLKSELYSSSDNSNMIPLDVVCKKFPDDGQVLLNILWEDFKELGERDGIEGCVRLQLADPNRRLHYFREMGLWQSLIAEADMGNQKDALSQGLLMSGFLTCASQLNNCCWDAAWRLNQWDIEPPFSGHENFSSLHYSAIRSVLHLKDQQNALSFLDPARELVLNDLADASLEVAASVYLPLAKLQLITELESWCKEESVCKEVPDSEWIHAEPILWQRGLLLADPQFWLSSAKIARSNSSHLIALKLLQHMKGLEISQEVQEEAKAEEAKIHWDSGNLETAKFLLRHLLDSMEDPLLKAKCLLTYGTWMSESKSEGPKAIITQYFQEAAALLETRLEERLAAAECLAKFADTEYQRITRYLKSPEYDMKKSHMDACRKNLKVFESNRNETLEEKKSVKIHQCNIETDEAEMDAIHVEHSSFLCLAVREYLYSLQFEKTTDDRMFRFVSLWLSNSKLAALQKEVDQFLNKVPLYRFIPVFPQLAVRISLDSDHFARSLRKLLYRCSEGHPHHCLWHLLALANADIDQPESETPPKARVLGAEKLLRELSKNTSAERIVQGMQELALAYINLANLQLPKNTRIGDSKIPKNERLRQIKDLTYITCATINTPVNKNADYSNIIGIVSFEEIFTVIGGINTPKRVKCLCTDGMKRNELVKGQDDPRQDALMQQVFSVLNILLGSDKNTASRKLSVRTYKVVPLTQKSGVIEWCNNTEPLGQYLQKAHAKHRPHDLGQSRCRALLEEVACRPPEEKLSRFLSICSKFKPVMRHFFFEKFPTSGVWYERRLAYIRSVATNSMIGYVMGIGDRHVFNILMDQETAEVIHIDFGISFELAKILPTPETVPFRLTRDIEDGMGITGVEGVFRRCCEETMRVLRKRSEPIMTTLEMLLYDPLYSWSVKPKSGRSQQPVPEISAAETNKLAERFLQRLKLKLDGREDCSETSSVEGQVRNLIQEARDPMNLCRLFRGWQAYL